jgi:hypothetical protein
MAVSSGEVLPCSGESVTGRCAVTVIAVWLEVFFDVSGDIGLPCPVPAGGTSAPGIGNLKNFAGNITGLRTVLS